MEERVGYLAALWVGLALIATLLAIWFRISTALSEIVVGTVAQLIIGAVIGIHGGLGAKTNWIGFLAGTGAIVLTFLAGAELDPVIFRDKVEGSADRWAGRLYRTVPRLHGDCALCPALERSLELAGWCCSQHDVRSGCLRSDARAGI